VVNFRSLLKSIGVSFFNLVAFMVMLWPRILKYLATYDEANEKSLARQALIDSQYGPEPDDSQRNPGDW
jgi:hypothetical protein